MSDSRLWHIDVVNRCKSMLCAGNFSSPSKHTCVNGKIPNAWRLTRSLYNIFDVSLQNISTCVTRPICSGMNCMAICIECFRGAIAQVESARNHVRYTHQTPDTRYDQHYLCHGRSNITPNITVHAFGWIVVAVHSDGTQKNALAQQNPKFYVTIQM